MYAIRSYYEEITGKLEVIDIGIPPMVTAAENVRQQVITARQVQAVLGQRPADSHKGRTGHLLVVITSYSIHYTKLYEYHNP